MRRIAIFTMAVLLSFMLLPFESAFSQEEQQQPALVSMDFENADIRDVIKVITMASGMNMVIGKDVDAKVTISLKEIPWERALDVILRTYNFTFKKEGNLIRIMTFEKVKQEERDIPLTTKIIYLNFADVSALQGTVTTILSERGSIEVDKRTNSMLITDIPARLEEVERVAKKLDTRTPQVLIEAMLVDVKLTKDDELGINWKIIHVDRHDAYNRSTSDNYIEQPESVMQEGISSAIKIGWLQEKLGSFRLNGLIQAWAQEDKANILASPKIVTLDNLTAKIEIKSQVAYTKVTESDQGGNTSSTQFKDVTTGLEVTPHITKEGFVSMNLKPKQEFIEGWPGGEPQIGSRSAETNVLVKDGETIVIGGLRKVEDSATITKIPILGDIPLLGGLFRKRDMNKINTELVMFVTPHIITQSELTDEEIEKYDMLGEEREEFLRKMRKEREDKLRRRMRRETGFLESRPVDLPVVTVTVPAAEVAVPLSEEKPAQPVQQVAKKEEPIGLISEEITGQPEAPVEEEIGLPAYREQGLPWQCDPDYIYVW